MSVVRDWLAQAYPVDPDEIVLIIEAGHLEGYRYRGWEARSDEIASWLTASQRYRLKRTGRLGPVVEARLRRGLADRTELSFRDMSNHERLRFLVAIRAESQPE